LLRHVVSNFGAKEIPAPELPYEKFFIEMKKKMTAEEERIAEEKKKEFEQTKMLISKAAWATAAQGTKLSMRDGRQPGSR